MCMGKFDAEKIFFDKLTGLLTEPFFQLFDVADILKMCMKKFDAEKIFFDKQYVESIK